MPSERSSPSVGWRDMEFEMSAEPYDVGNSPWIDDADDGLVGASLDDFGGETLKPGGE